MSVIRLAVFCALNRTYLTPGGMGLTPILPKIKPKHKLFRNDEHVREGDVVLFKKVESSFAAGSYRNGMVETVHRSADSQICTVTIRYRNSSKTKYCTAEWAVHSLIIIH